MRVALWSEVQSDGREIPFYGISLDGVAMNTVRETSYVLKLRWVRRISGLSSTTPHGTAGPR